VKWSPDGEWRGWREWRDLEKLDYFFLMDRVDRTEGSLYIRCSTRPILDKILLGHPFLLFPVSLFQIETEELGGWPSYHRVIFQ
jgi:hypothetical protein